MPRRRQPAAAWLVAATLDAQGACSAPANHPALNTMDINLPDIHAELSAAFARYEHALVTNLVDELDALFWPSTHTVRYGAAENLHGIAAIRAFRAVRPSVGLARTSSDTVITTFGRDMGTAMTTFSRSGSPKVGRQSQTWVRLPAGWQVVAAHVSLIDPPA